MILNTIIALIIAITIHEFAHAFMADRLGDPTPRASGRLTLNPLAHLDPIGTLMLFIARFGWGKPVPIDTYNLKNPRRDEILISLAGPASNIILAIIFTILFKFFAMNLFLSIIIINLSLAIFNLLPFYPLDGSHIFPDLFPKGTGQLILIFMILPIFNGSSLIFYFISPIINFCLKLLSYL
jgi:Zn-dependent protease